MSEQMDRVMRLDLWNDSEHKPPKLRAMGFGELLDTTFSLYRKHFRSFLGISSGYFIAMFIVISIVYLDDPVGRNAKIAIWVPTIGVFFGCFVFIISSLISANVQAYLVGTVKTGAALTQGVRQFLPCFISSLVFGLGAVLLAAMLATLLVVLHASLEGDDSPSWYYVGLLMLILIWVLGCFVTYWCFFAAAILVEGKSIRASVRRSRDLIRGTWWRVAGMVLAIFFFSFAINCILRGTFGCLLTLTGLTDEGFVKIFRMGMWDISTTQRGLNLFKALMYVINLGADTITMPIWVIGSTLLYFDQRIRKEGFDIEMMATHQGEDGEIRTN